MTVTIADVLSEIKRQLDWRGPNDRKMGHIVLKREMGQYAHDLTIKVLLERDELVAEKEKPSRPGEG